MSDRDADAIVAGNLPAGEDELEELALFFREARNVLAEPPTAATAAAHLTAIAETVRAADLQGADRQESVPPKQRRLRSPFALPVRLGAAAAGVALVAAFGGAAYAGGLPDPVQGKVADLVSNVGISLPGNHNDVDQGDVGNVDQGNQGRTDQGNQGRTDQGNQGRTDQTNPVSTDKSNPGNHNQDPQPKTDDGAHAKTGDGAHAKTDDGAHAKTDDGANPSIDDGPQPKTGDSKHPTTDGGVQPQTDDGAHSNTGDGAKPDTDGAHGDGENG